MIVKATFEETFPHYPFSDLVRLGIRLGAWLRDRAEGGSEARYPSERQSPRPAHG
jgi:hypothetical protein